MKHRKQYGVSLLVALLLVMLLAATTPTGSAQRPTPTAPLPDYPTWLELIDTPYTYDTKAHQVPNVNAAEEGLEFSDALYVDDYRVGVGTNVPALRLVVDTLGDTDGIQIVSNTTGDTTYDGFTMVNYADDIYINNREAKSIYFYTNNAFAMVIDEDNYVGINDTSPSYELDVTGDAQVTNDLYVGHEVGIGTTTPHADLEVAGQIFQGNIYDAEVDKAIIGGNNSEGGYLVWAEDNVPGTGLTIFNGGAGPREGVWVSAIGKCSVNDDVQHHEAFLVPGEQMYVYNHSGGNGSTRCGFVLYLTDDSPPEMYIEHPVVLLYSAQVSLLMHWLN